MSESTQEAAAENEAVATPSSLADLRPKMKVSGRVVKLELYGAFIDIGVGANALVHISKLGRENVNRVADVLSEGDEVEVWVEKVDPGRGQAMVTMVEPLAVEWNELSKGQVRTGRVTRLERYGAFVDIGAEREGLVHISELSHDYVKHPQDAVKVGDEVQVQVLGHDRRKRRIDLSVKALLDQPETSSPGRGQGQRQGRGRARQPEPVVTEEDMEEEEELPTAMEVALRRALGDEEPDEPPPTPGRRQPGRKRSRRERRRQHRESILERTLQLQRDEEES